MPKYRHLAINADIKKIQCNMEAVLFYNSGEKNNLISEFVLKKIIIFRNIIGAMPH